MAYYSAPKKLYCRKKIRYDYSNYFKIKKIRKPFFYNKSQSIKNHVQEYFGLTYSIYKMLIRQGCRYCNSTKSINLHHITSKSKGGTNNIANLIPLCKSCHLKVHNKQSW